MAASRSRRTNAGSKMASLLNEEESSVIASSDNKITLKDGSEEKVIGDEIYSTLYGGFKEENDDIDFEYDSDTGLTNEKSEFKLEKIEETGDAEDANGSSSTDINGEDESDSADSDFSIDEDDEVKSDVEDDKTLKVQERKEKGGGVSRSSKFHVKTKAYSELKKSSTLMDNSHTKKKLAMKKKKKSVKLNNNSFKHIALNFGRKEARATTLVKTAETAKRQKARVEQAKKLFQKRQIRDKLGESESIKCVVMTQEEILEEAKLTEELNVESLRRYQMMELEAKKRAVRVKNKTISGPYIRYLSTAMPILGGEIQEDNTDIVIGREERTFISFSRFEDFRDSFPAAVKKVVSIVPQLQNNCSVVVGLPSDSNSDTVTSSTPPQQTVTHTISPYLDLKRRVENQRVKKVCPITRLPAPYFDPVTQQPYANIQAFRILRQLYKDQLLEAANECSPPLSVGSDPPLERWLEWARKNEADNSLCSPRIVSNVSETPATFQPPVTKTGNIRNQASSAVPTPSEVSIANGAVQANTTQSQQMFRSSVSNNPNNYVAATNPPPTTNFPSG